MLVSLGMGRWCVCFVLQVDHWWIAQATGAALEMVLLVEQKVQVVFYVSTARSGCQQKADWLGCPA